MIRTQSLVRALLVVVFTYFVSLGATFNGLLIPQFQTYTLGAIAALVILWLFLRWRGGWGWHRTPLDGVILLWGAAFIVSLLANTESWRRIAIGLWYVSVYIGVWYALQDTLANRGIWRESLVAALLIAGLVVIVIGYWQAQTVLSSQTGGFTLPRPVSLLGNSNALGAFLVILIPFAVGRAVSARARLQRVVMSAYTALALVLLVLTFSRGAWLGALAAAAVGGLLYLSTRGMLSRPGLQGWWRALQGTRKLTITVLGLAVLAGIAAGGWFFLQSFTGGRSTELRTPIYASAVAQFVEEPLTGHGLFTFGKGLMADWSMPPNQAHSHAHDIPLDVAAELGLIGLAALTATLFVIARQARRNWQTFSPRDRMTLAAAIAAMVGFGVHHLVDMPAMMPAIALTGLIVLALVLTPQEPAPVTVRWQSVGRTSALALLWMALIVSGFWSSGVYSRYIDVLSAAVQTGDYAGAAQNLQPVIDADPSLAVYSMEQGFLYGMAANDDRRYVTDAIAAYEQFLALEPEHAVSWANVAALYWQAGEPDRAIAAISQAVALAPEEPTFARNLQRYSGSGNDIVSGEAGLFVDYLYGLSFAHFQYLREMLPRMFLPQVDYPIK